MKSFFSNNIRFFVGLFIGIVICAYGFNTTLPSPAAASKQAQELITEAGAPSLLVRKYLVPQTSDQWKSATQQIDGARDLDVAELKQQLNVSISEEVINGVNIHRISPANTPVANALFIYIHGGAYVAGGGYIGAAEGALISSLTGIETISIDYRMPPDHPFPAAVDDVEAVYRDILDNYPNAKIGIGGTSAGGGLSAASIHNFKAKGLALPHALYLGTPWTDLTKTSDTLYTLEGIDQTVATYDGFIEAAAHLYAGKEELTHPLISPVYGNFTLFPPTYLVTGTRDLLLSDTARIHRKLRQAGVKADLNVYEGLSHAQYAFLRDAPEHKEHYAALAEFLNKHLQ